MGNSLKKYSDWRVKVTPKQFLIMLLKAMLVIVWLYFLPRAIVIVIGKIMGVDLLAKAFFVTLFNILYLLSKYITIFRVLYILLKYKFFSVK